MRKSYFLLLTAICFTLPNIVCADLLVNGDFETIPDNSQGQGILPSSWIQVSDTVPGADTYSTDGSHGLLPGSTGAFANVTPIDGIRFVAAAEFGIGGPNEAIGQQLTNSLISDQSYSLVAYIRPSFKLNTIIGGLDIILSPTPDFDDASALTVGTLATTENVDDWQFRKTTFVAPQNSDQLHYFILAPRSTSDRESYIAMDRVQGISSGNSFPISGDNHLFSWTPRSPANFYRLTFDRPINAFGFWMTDPNDYFGNPNNFPPSASLDILIEGAFGSRTINALPGIDINTVQNASAGFFGLVSDDPFTSVTFVHSDNANGSNGGDSIGFDDIYVSTVPEPNTDIIDFEGTGFAEGTVLSTLPGHLGVHFDTGILVLPGNPRFGFNGSSQGGPGGIDNANSAATYTAPDGTGKTVSISFDFFVSELSFDAVDIEITTEVTELLSARVYDSESGGNLLDTVVLTGGDPGTGDGLLTPIVFTGITGIRRLEFEAVTAGPVTAGYAIDNLSFTWVAAPVSFNVTRGEYVSGTVQDLFSSDNLDLVVRRNPSDVQSRVFVEFKSTSSTETPSEFQFTFEAAVFARSDVGQSIDLFNYQTNQFEEVDSRSASRFTDQVVTVEPGGDLSQFIEPGTKCVEARVRFQSANARQQFSANIDQVVWSID